MTKILKMEKLNAKIGFGYFIEIVVCYLLILLSGKVDNIGPFFIFWYFACLIINIVAIVLLSKHKPKYYVVLIFLGIFIIGFPLWFLYMLSNVRMC